MGNVCCNSGLQNYGRGQCVTQIDRVVSLVIVPEFDSSNAYNQIILATAFDATTLTGLVTNADATKRWVKMPRFYGVSTPIADTVFDESTDGTKSFVREGIWSFAGETRDKDAIAGILKKMKALRCSNFSAYLVTASNQLVGQIVGNGIMRPLKINGGSLDPKMNLRDDSTTNKIMFGFDFDNLVKQENLYVLDGTDLSVDFLNTRQLTDVSITKTDLTATTIEVDLKTSFVQGLTPNNDVIGLLAAAFKLENLTASTTVTITTVVEDVNIDGRYLITFPAQTTTDRMKLSMVLTSYYNGSYEFDAL